MKYIFYLIFSKVGIVFSGSGRCRLDSALSAFTRAKDELQMAISHELETIIKNDISLKKARIKFEKKEKKLTERTEAHMNTRVESLAYLNKIENFLKIDVSEDDKENADTTPGQDDAETDQVE